jgi:hypothetical protein
MGTKHGPPLLVPSDLDWEWFEKMKLCIMVALEGKDVTGD